MTGQGSFERNFISFLIKKNDNTIIFTVNDKSNFEHTHIKYFKLDKSSKFSYMAYQIKMFLPITKEILNSKRENVKIYIRLAPYNFIPFILAKLFKIDITIRSGPVHLNLLSYRKVNSKVLLKVFKRIIKYYYDSALSIIVVTDKIKKIIMQDFNIKDEKIVIIPNPINNDLFDNKRNYRLRKKRKNIHFGFVGNIYKDQGVHHIIEAVNLLEYKQKVKITIVGDGEYVGVCKRLVIKYNLNGLIEFVGRVKPQNVVEYIEDFDICLAPFTKSDYNLRGSSALKILEYLYCNKPVITINVKEYHYIIKKKYGFLYDADDIKQLSILINHIIVNGIKVIDSKSYINQTFSKKIIFNQYLKTIRGKDV
jgi:glycosyltransferase involved in cell wall biosynthesis